MSKQLIVRLDGVTSVFELNKIHRARLYGERSRVRFDESGVPCTRADVTPDGTLARKSALERVYVDDEGNGVDRSEVGAMGPDGKALPVYPSTLGVAQELEGGFFSHEVLDFQTDEVYLLETVNLHHVLAYDLALGRVYGLKFNSRASATPKRAYLVTNDHGIFLLVGHHLGYAWIDADTAPSSEKENDDELDFAMLA